MSSVWLYIDSGDGGAVMKTQQENTEDAESSVGM